MQIPNVYYELWTTIQKQHIYTIRAKGDQSTRRHQLGSISGYKCVRSCTQTLA